MLSAKMEVGRTPGLFHQSYYLRDIAKSCWTPRLSLSHSQIYYGVEQRKNEDLILWLQVGSVSTQHLVGLCLGELWICGARLAAAVYRHKSCGAFHVL
jgi:hypothetical protein